MDSTRRCLLVFGIAVVATPLLGGAYLYSLLSGLVDQNVKEASFEGQPMLPLELHLDANAHDDATLRSSLSVLKVGLCCMFGFSRRGDGAVL